MTSFSATRHSGSATNPPLIRQSCFRHYSLHSVPGTHGLLADQRTLLIFSPIAGYYYANRPPQGAPRPLQGAPRNMHNLPGKNKLRKSSNTPDHEFNAVWPSGKCHFDFQGFACFRIQLLMFIGQSVCVSVCLCASLCVAPPPLQGAPHNMQNISGKQNYEEFQKRPMISSESYSF